MINYEQEAIAILRAIPKFCSWCFDEQDKYGNFFLRVESLKDNKTDVGTIRTIYEYLERLAVIVYELKKSPADLTDLERDLLIAIRKQPIPGWLYKHLDNEARQALEHLIKIGYVWQADVAAREFFLTDQGRTSVDSLTS